MMKKLIIALAAVLMIGTQNALAESPFSDVPETHWAYGSINMFTESGVINGYEDGSFRPDNPVTRGEWAKLMCDALGIRQSGMMGLWQFYASAADMSESDWSAPYMAAVTPYLTHERDSYGRLYYYPNEPSAREEVACSLVRVLELAENDTNYTYLNSYTDGWEVSEFEHPYMNAAVEYGIISGYEDGTLRPKRQVTRAEAACLLQRTISRSFVMQPRRNEAYSYVK